MMCIEAFTPNSTLKAGFKWQGICLVENEQMSFRLANTLKRERTYSGLDRALLAAGNANSVAREISPVMQNAILRYSRSQICVTLEVG